MRVTVLVSWAPSSISPSGAAPAVMVAWRKNPAEVKSAAAGAIDEGERHRPAGREMDWIGREAIAPHLDEQLSRLLSFGGGGHKQRHHRDTGRAGKIHRMLLPLVSARG